MADYKPLVINSTKPNIPSADTLDWKDFSKELQSHAQYISTGSTNEKKTANLGAIVSGVPTVYARSYLFKLAFAYQLSGQKAGGSLNKFYSSLVSEWKGLISCIALQYQSLEVERIDLDYSEGNDIDNQPSGLYEPKGAFGTMLFEDRLNWCEVGKNIPFIEVLKFGMGAEKVIVGGTTPDSLLFTPASYSIKDAQECPFVNGSVDPSEKGRFIDPLTDDVSKPHPILNHDQCCALYAYVYHLTSNAIPAYLNYFRQNRDINIEVLQTNVGNAKRLLDEWLRQILDYALKNGWEDDVKNASIPNVNTFAHLPFSNLFNFSEDLFGHNGFIFEDEGEGRIKFDPKSLLLPKDDAYVAEFNFPSATQHPEYVQGLPVTILPASNENSPSEFRFFALPLTQLGVKVFGKNLHSLVSLSDDKNRDIPSKLRATYKLDTIKNRIILLVELILVGQQSNKQKSFSREYELMADNRNLINKKALLLWPNFISKHWNNYYLYSEIPSNWSDRSCIYNLFPFACDTDNDLSIIVEDAPGKSVEERSPLYLNNDETKDKLTDLVAKRIVVADNRTEDKPFKYEIFESNKPFKGMMFIESATGKQGGFIIVDYSNHSISNKCKDEGETISLHDAYVGVDFGSTNTSVAYCPSYKEGEREDPEEFVYKNRRISLLGNEKDRVVLPCDVFFFNRLNIQSNAVKSILTVHDKSRLSVVIQGEPGDQAVVGGFPCVERNLPIESVTSNKLSLKFPVFGRVEAASYYNMKWSTNPQEQAHIKAYLKTMLLSTYAELYDQNLQPVQLKWSYPSSMSGTDVSNYNDIWSGLNKLNPIKNGKQLTILTASLDIKKNRGVGSSGFGGSQGLSSSGFGGGQGLGSSGFGGGQGFGSSGFGGGQGFGSSGSSSDGFGQSSTSQSPFGSGNAFGQSTGISLKDLASSSDISEIDEPAFTGNLKPLDKGRALTESEAVANFMTNQLSDGFLLCFDVGGSTTDFSVLTKVGGYKVLVKQSSIRFAAQRISSATVRSLRFKDVVVEMCNHYNIKIGSLNEWNPDVDNSKASYYFERMVDELSNEQLPEFYGKIRSYCPELFCVNLYVTGLIMFYAGQISRKLITEMRNNNIFEKNDPVEVVIHFAGKGAKIFDWLYEVDRNAFNQYYIQMMYADGLGDNPNQYVKFNSFDAFIQRPAVTKYEVSKGLAMAITDLHIFKDLKALEIIGEDFFVVKNSKGEFPMEFDRNMTIERMRNLGRGFKIKQMDPFKTRFFKFMWNFFQLASYSFIQINPDKLNQAFLKMNIVDYITKSDEYKRAEASGVDFDYVAPIIILEGMEFYDKFLADILKK